MSRVKINYDIGIDKFIKAQNGTINGVKYFLRFDNKNDVYEATDIISDILSCIINKFGGEYIGELETSPEKEYRRYTFTETIHAWDIDRIVGEVFQKHDFKEEIWWEQPNKIWGTYYKEVIND